MIAGTFFLDVENMENYYKRAQKIRTIIKKELKEIFETVDAIAVPANSEYTCLANLSRKTSNNSKRNNFNRKLLRRRQVNRVSKKIATIM